MRDKVKEIGYDDLEKGLDYKTMEFKMMINEQSHEIAHGVHVGKDDYELGAGDQGHVFG